MLVHLRHCDRLYRGTGAINAYENSLQLMHALDQISRVNQQSMDGTSGFRSWSRNSCWPRRIPRINSSFARIISGWNSNEKYPPWTRLKARSSKCLLDRPHPLEPAPCPPPESYRPHHFHLHPLMVISEGNHPPRFHRRLFPLLNPLPQLFRWGEKSHDVDVSVLIERNS